MKELKQYYRRRLPHYQPKDSILFATFRLANFLPKEIVAQLHQERNDREKEIQKKSNIEKRLSLIEDEQKRYFGHFDSYLLKLRRMVFSSKNVESCHSSVRWNPRF